MFGPLVLPLTVVSASSSASQLCPSHPIRSLIFCRKTKQLDLPLFVFLAKSTILEPSDHKFQTDLLVLPISEKLVQHTLLRSWHPETSSYLNDTPKTERNQASHAQTAPVNAMRLGPVLKCAIFSRISNLNQTSTLATCHPMGLFNLFGAVATLSKWIHRENVRG